MMLIWTYLSLGAITCTAWTTTRLRKGELVTRDFYYAPVETVLVALMIVGLWPAVLIDWCTDIRRG